MNCQTLPNSQNASSSSPNSTYSSSYQYDARGLRISDTPASGVSQGFIYDTVTSSVPKIIEDGTNAYIYGPELYGPGTGPVEQISINTQTPVVSYLFSDPLGVRTIWNSSGSIVQCYFYSTYGQQIACVPGGTTTPFSFEGGYEDSTGLIYLINRYYDPTTDQFITLDPLLSQTGQPYSFVGGDPVNGSDPSGMGPRAPQLSASEKEALSQKAHGEPVKNEKALNSALRKIQESEKYGGANATRNKHKRSSNFDLNPLPVIGSGIESAGSAVWGALSQAGQWLWAGVVAVGVAMWWIVGVGGRAVASASVAGGAGPC